MKNFQVVIVAEVQHKDATPRPVEWGVRNRVTGYIVREGLTRKDAAAECDKLNEEYPATEE